MISRLRNAEHFFLHSMILYYLGKKTDLISEIDDLYREYGKRFEREHREFMPLGQQRMTKELVSLNKKRFRALTYIRRANRLMSMSEKADEQEAARRIGDVLHKYRKAGYEAYAENTALIMCIVADLRTPPYAQAL